MTVFSETRFLTHLAAGVTALAVGLGAGPAAAEENGYDNGQMSEVSSPSPGCNALNSGEMNLTAKPGMGPVQRSRTYPFAKGETVKVMVENANPGDARLGMYDLLNNAMGMDSASWKLPSGGSKTAFGQLGAGSQYPMQPYPEMATRVVENGDFNGNGDYNGNGNNHTMEDATMTWSCTPAGGNGNGPPPQDLNNGALTGLDAIDGIRPPTNPGAFPSRFGPPPRRLFGPNGNGGEVARNASPLSLTTTDGETLRFSTQALETDNGDMWFWTRGRIGLITGERFTDGYFGNVQVGFVQALNPAVDIGFYGSILSATSTQAAPALKLDTTGLGAGVYTMFSLGTTFQGGLSAFYERSDNTASLGGVTGNFDRDYLTFDATLERPFTFDMLTVVPGLTAGVEHSHRGAYTDSAGNSFASLSETRFSAGTWLDVSRTFEVNRGNIRSITPSGEVGVGVNMQTRADRSVTNGTVALADTVNGRADAGATIRFRGGATLDLRAGITGIGAPAQFIFGSFGYRLNF